LYTADFGRRKCLPESQDHPLMIDSAAIISPLLYLGFIIFQVKSKERPKMGKSVKLALTILVLMLAVAFLSHFLDWMNLPSDSWFWGGVLGALLLLVAVPSLLAAIWRTEHLK
jgi:drug/metabolite transporter (DMT)-like permease